jgi:hypothetical protein
MVLSQASQSDTRFNTYSPVSLEGRQNHAVLALHKPRLLRAPVALQVGLRRIRVCSCKANFPAFFPDARCRLGIVRVPMVSTASTLTPPRHSWHPRAFSRDIHTLTNRSRVNPGHYVLWVDRSNRVRIHEMVRDYEVDVIPLIRPSTARSARKKGPGSQTRHRSRKPQTRNKFAQMSRSVNVVNIFREGEPDPQSAPKVCVSPLRLCFAGRASAKAGLLLPRKRIVLIKRIR